MKREHRDAVIDYFVARDRLGRSLNGNPLIPRGGRDYVYEILKWMLRQDLLRKYPVDPRKDPEHLPALLRDAAQRRDENQVEAAMLLGFEFGFSRSCLPGLHALLMEDWHISHEDIAMVLQEMHDPSSIDVLYRAAQLQFDYLSFDEAYALGVKCCYALGDINTTEGDEKLRLLAELDNPVIAKAARYQFERDVRPVRQGGGE